MISGNGIPAAGHVRLTESLVKISRLMISPGPSILGGTVQRRHLLHIVTFQNEQLCNNMNVNLPSGKSQPNQ